MKIKRLTFLFIVLSFIIALTACNIQNRNNSLEQLKMPNENEEIAVFYTNYGKIKIRLFDDVAPKAVENFKGLINKKVYDNKIFFRIRKDDFIISGAPEYSSIWGKEFEDEFDMQYHHLRGAVSMVNSGADSNINSFFIVKRDYLEDEIKNLIGEFDETDGFPKNVVKAYKKLGGLPELDYEHTVFGQVFEGMKVVDDISNVKVDSDYKPIKDVIIENAKIEKYHK